MNLIVNQINYGLIKEGNFIMKLCENGWATMMFLMYPTYNEGKSVMKGL